MSLSPGQRLGAYEIVSALGAGGMGEVYRARDTKLLRDVAIKVLPDSMAADRDRLARFEREAQLLAALNHPHIAGIYGLEQIGDTSFLAMELVDGETLADRIARGGALAVGEALAIAKQLGDALQAAHDKGIIHRDLKPANIALTADGQVKVLDFGLAKIVEASGASGAGGVTMSPTMSLAMTQAGMILGTAAYMSPEQAKGRQADKRSDVWAFGCVLFEMLTGKRAFEGEDASDTLAAVLRGEPDWKRLPRRTPAHVRHVIERCLEKDRVRRLADVSVVNYLLHDASPARSTAGGDRSWLATRAAWGAAAIATIAAVALAAYVMTRPAPVPSTTRFTFTPPAGQLLTQANSATSVLGGYPTGLAISPDGRHVAFLANAATGRSQIWIRSLDALTARPLPGTDGASGPFWSPDSRFVAFFADGRLRKIDISGGPPVTLTEAPDYRGGTWGRDGIIVFAPGSTGGLLKVSDAGGVATPATTQVKGDTGHARPTFLPDGRRFFYRVYNGGLHLASLDAPGRTTIFENPDANNVAYANGHLLFLRETSLMAQPFDLETGTLRGEPAPIAEDILTGGNPPVAMFSVSETGVLVYVAGDDAIAGRQLSWIEPGGKPVGVLGEPGDHADVNLSPDGARTAVSVLERGQRQRDIWIYDNARGIRSRFTFGDRDDQAPIWSPDGRQIVFSSRRQEVFDLLVKPSGGAGAEQVLFADDRHKNATAWSSDGRFLLFVSGALGVGAGADIMVLPMTGDRKPRPYLATPYSEVAAQFSPDDTWIAYMSNESGRNEVYVSPFPEPSAKFTISAAGGGVPRWSADGRTIFYTSPELKMMAADLAVSAGDLRVIRTRELFDASGIGGARYNWDVAANGRFLVNVTQTRTAPDITVVMNWTNLLER